jgi:hypothetical protein
VLPPAGRCMAKDRFIEILQKLMEPVHEYKILNFESNTWLDIYIRD